MRHFFHWLKDQGLSDNGRHTYLRALRTWFNFLVRRKVIPQFPLVDADLRIRAVWQRLELPRANRLHRIPQQMKADVLPSGAKAPDFIRLRDYAMVLWYIEAGARRREGLVRVDDLDPEFVRATTVQKVRREAQTRPLFYHAIRHLIRYYLEERERFLRAIGKEDVRALWVTDDGVAADTGRGLAHLPAHQAALRVGELVPPPQTARGRRDDGRAGEGSDGPGDQDVGGRRTRRGQAIHPARAGAGGTYGDGGGQSAEGDGPIASAAGVGFPPRLDSGLRTGSIETHLLDLNPQPFTAQVTHRRPNTTTP